MKPQHPSNPALEAAERLVAAYRRGKERGGEIDWSDLDIAHEWARRAVAEARQQSRNARRRREPATEEGRATAPQEVLDALDGRLVRLRELAAALVADNDESQDEALETACELSSILLEVDHDAGAGALPRAWQRD